MADYTDYAATMEKQYEYLDKIDIEKYMLKCKSGSIRDLMNKIEDDYDGTELTFNDFLDGCIFNVCDENEFIRYLHKRYGKQFHSHERIIILNTFSFKKDDKKQRT